MKISLSTILLFLLQNYLIAQTKPELPPNFYDTFSYSLPKNFQYTDHEQLSSEIQKLGTELLKWQKRAVEKYSITDSTELYYATASLSDLDIFFKNYQSAIDRILAARKLRPSPVYQAPYSLIKLAYCKTCMVHKEDGSNEFLNLFTEYLITEFRNINNDFRSDIVNQAKGNIILPLLMYGGKMLQEQ
jgi:hypothetical protein